MGVSACSRRHLLLEYSAPPPCSRSLCDDFFMIEGAHVAMLGFRSFQDIHSALGFRMKKAKEKPPAAEQVGVREYVQASAGTDRIHKIQQMIAGILESGEKSQQTAAKLAGKT